MVNQNYDPASRAKHIENLFLAVQSSGNLLLAPDALSFSLKRSDLWVQKSVSRIVAELGKLEEKMYEEFFNKTWGQLSNDAFDYDLQEGVSAFNQEEEFCPLTYARKKLAYAKDEKERIDKQISLWEQKVKEFSENQPIQND